MNISINLLKESQHLQARLRRMGLMLQTGSLVVLVAFAAVVFFTISYLVWSQTQANRLNSDIDQAKVSIEEMRPRESKLLYVKQKLSFATRVLGEPGLRHDLATELYRIAEGEVEVSHMTISGGDEAFRVEAQASDVFSLVRLLDLVMTFAGEHDINRISGESFTRTAEGGYQFSVLLALGGE